MLGAAKHLKALLACITFWSWISFCFVFTLPFAFIKLLVPHRAVRRRMTRCIEAIAWFHSRGLTVILHTLSIGRYRFVQAPPLQPDKSYLLICNHQSWVDILLLMECLRTRAPWPRFFLKQQLLWVPVIGFFCWAMDYPFMKRYSREQIAADPSLAGKDLAATRKACERYQGLPISMINFVEGTRASPAKIAASQSPYRNLLKPKTGGVAFAMAAMGDQFDAVVDVTFVYPELGGPDFWGFCRGEQQPVLIDMQVLDVPPELDPAAYSQSDDTRARFQDWISDVWSAKDARIDAMRSQINS